MSDIDPAVTLVDVDILKDFAKKTERCVDFQQRQAHTIINDLMSRGDGEFHQWVTTQPSGQQISLHRAYGSGREIAVTQHVAAHAHADALRSMLRWPWPTTTSIAYLTMARGAVEAATMFAYLTDREVAPEQRLLRAACAVRQGWSQESTLARDVGNQNRLEHLSKFMKNHDAELATAGITPHCNSKSEQIGYQRNGDRTLTKVNVTEEAKRYFTRLVAPYRLGSAAAHSGWWFVQQSTQRSGTQVRARFESTHVLSAVVAVLESFLVMATACNSPHDTTVPALASKTRFRRKVVLDLHKSIERAAQADPA